MIYQHITELIGNTPLLKIDSSVHGLKNIDLYAKLEFYNPFGSVKDRIGWAMIKDDIEDIKKKQQTILESSSGNTAKALQAIASVYGIPFKTITNRIKVDEVKQILQVMGAEIEQMPGRSECPDPADPNDPLTHIEQIMRQEKDKYYYTTQYTNNKNVQAHYETGEEIINDLKVVDYFIGGLGTTGSTRGAAESIKRVNKNLTTIGVVSSINDYIPGIRTINEMWEVGLFDKQFYRTIEEISSLDALSGMLTLIRKCGILAGPTSGASYKGAIQYLKTIDRDLEEKKTAVFIVCDRFEYYISYIKERRPDLFGQQAKADSLLAFPQEELKHAKSLSLDGITAWIEVKKPLIIDIRSNIAYMSAHIPGSINIPQDQLNKIVDGTMPFPEAHTILFVCPIGEQSKKYAAYLFHKGYDAYTLESGITGWRDNNLPLERTKRDNQI